MPQSTALKRKVEDKEGTQFFPITHVEAVIDNNGNSVDTLLDGKIYKSSSVQATTLAQCNGFEDSHGNIYSLPGDETLSSASIDYALPAYVLCASEAAYEAIQSKDSHTLYLIPEEQPQVL